jgi:hypothetical protein
VIKRHHTKVAYQRCISTIEVAYQRRISTTYQCCISTIETTYQRCISTRSLRYLSGQSHLGKLFKSRTLMVDICKWSYIINAIKEYRLLGFSPCTRFPQGICVVDMHAYSST